MKKLVLAIAVVFTCLSLSAQKETMATLKMGKENMLSKQAVSQLMSPKKKLQKKSVADGTTLLCDFSDATAYSFGTTANHSYAEGFTYLNASAQSSSESGYVDCNNKWWTLALFGEPFASYDNWYGHIEPANYPTEVSEFENSYYYLPMSIWNGFAAIDLYYGSNSQSANDAVEAFVKINTPIVTDGNAIDINFVQFVYAVWNRDYYFIDWSTNPNFEAGTYDSVEFNVKRIEAEVGDAGSNNTFGRKLVNLPTGTNICNLATPGQQIYIRFRVTAEAPGSNVAGYQWFLDDISYASAPESRIELNQYHVYDGYRRIPTILVPENFRNVAQITNTGSNTVTASLRNTFGYAGYDQATEEMYYDEISTSSSEVMQVENSIEVNFYDTLDDGNPDLSNPTVTRYRTLTVSDDAIAQPVPSSVETQYYISSDVIYSLNGEEHALNCDTNYYIGAVEDPSKPHCYVWQKDMGILYNRYSGVWNYYYPNSGSYSSGQVAYENNYKVCLAYTAQGLTDESSNVYLAGVEVVPAIDSCEAGATIRASLMKYNGDATSWDNAIIPVTDAQGQAIQSANRTMTNSDLNNGIGENPSDRFSQGEYNTVYLPFTDGSTVMEPNETYYACYQKVGSTGKFYVAKDYDYWNSYAWESALGCLIYSPTLSQSEQYSWGLYWFASYSSYSVPFIRMVVSDIPNSSLAQVSTEAASSMSAYPNPASDKVTLSYMINQTGNVNITVTDLMGRVVASQNEGIREAGSHYNSSLNVSNLTAGTYFYTLEVNGVKSTNKLIINR
ncbi:MAG: T9SS type A sorting domain-containing protein [Bacteroidales bacterium]|nr:T9SS type A sorting domain-containing protein [Bacteroidales bacterium]